MAQPPRFPKDENSVLRRPNVQVASSSYIRVNTSEDSEWVEMDSIPEGYPPLNFRPLVLRFSFLVSVLLFFLTCLIATITLLWRSQKYGSIHTSTHASYFAIRYLPTVAGTITSLLWKTISGNFNRITPYISMATHHGQTWRKTLAAPYLFSPGLDWGAGHWLLAAVIVQQFFLVQLIPLKSVLLSNTPVQNGWETEASRGVAYTLIVIYIFLVCSTITMIVNLWNCRTGLKWDPVSIADQLFLLHRSDILKDFAYFDSASRETINEYQKDAVYRLGYWKKGTEIRYGIGQGANHTRVRRLSIGAPESPPRRSVYPGLSTPMMVGYTVVAYGTAAAIVYGFLKSGVRDGFHVNNMSLACAQFNFRALLTFLVTCYNVLWFNADIFHRAMQPFVGMYHSSPQPASENLLLDYPSLPPIIVSMKAAMNGHWKVAYFSLLSLTTNLLPILVATLCTMTSTGTGVTVTINARNFYSIAIFVFVYCVSIPFAWPRRKRLLPRYIYSLGDLISFCYDSKLLTDDDHAAIFTSNKPTDTKRHLESRLFLKEDLYAFRVYPKGGCWRAGFDVVSSEGLMRFES